MSTLAVLLKESWSHVEDRADDMATYFYARIFHDAPDLRELFPVAMTEQRSRMLVALSLILQSVDDPDRLDRVLRRLGRDHRKYGIAPEHYGTVGSALLEALRRYSGHQWSVEYDQAWRDAYDAIAGKMLMGSESETVLPPFWYAEVTAHARRARDIAVFSCRPLAPTPPLRFKPGQYVSLECTYHPCMWRTYSIANAPRADGTMDFHVRARPDGWVSAALVRRLRVGDRLRVGEPLGTMTLDARSPRDIVCVAGGTGLAPIRSLVEQLARGNGSQWVHVFVGARDREDLYDLAAMDQLAARHPWLSVIPACSDDATYPGERGPVNEVVERFGPWPDHDFFVCGSAAMVRATLGSLTRLGVPRSRIRYDAVSNR
jgi:NAD(P)H-flavin reductase